jgi:glycosyltransferase involved in cell wall biosynthesis
MIGERIRQALRGAERAWVILSPNPVHDTGGGQRSAQLAFELLERGHAVVFVAHGEVTETRDLGLRLGGPRMVEVPLSQWRSRARRQALQALVHDSPAAAPPVVITQVPLREWLPTIRAVRDGGGLAVFDLIDLWESELGAGWYQRPAEADTARESDLLLASAPALAARLEALVGRPAHLLPNAFNQRIFRGADRSLPLPAGFPDTPPVALYVGALWGGWLDWELARTLALALPAMSFVYVGDYRGEGRALPENCHFPGLQPQAALPAYLAHADVSFLPWRAGPVTHATSPLKVYEYLSMGLPVVAPPLDALRGLPGVTLAGDAAAFTAALTAGAAEPPGDALRAEMAAFASRNSWAARVDSLLELVRSWQHDAQRGSARRRRFGFWSSRRGS